MDCALSCYSTIFIWHNFNLEILNNKYNIFYLYKITMKLILSRKGFDSQYGGIPSPILPDGTLVPLPIPSAYDSYTMADINISNTNINDILIGLSKGRYNLETTVHLDPDLSRPTAEKPLDWRPALGQTGTAQSHLKEMKVGINDVFLFFGWFRQIDCTAGNWHYVRNAPNLHIIFGWIEVGEVLPVVEQRNHCLSNFPWIKHHPHVMRADHYTDLRNTLYIAKNFSQYIPNTQGGGRFSKYKDILRLTKPGKSRSVWSLPNWFMPNNRPPLSYHPRPQQWFQEDNCVVLQSAAKGQEFVLDCTLYPEAEEWFSNIIKDGVAL
jgi:hypothetical protein